MIRATRGTQNPLDLIEQQLRRAIFGQERAIESIIRALNRAQLGFSAGNQRRPFATLLFLGPTGVGKTETARRIAHFLHPTEPRFLKIDCSMFSQGHEVSALVGAPPSYVGRDQKPLINPDIVEQERSVVLFDEIEKGQPELWNLLLQIMEDGEILLLNGGRRVSFRHSIIIFTTNVGAKEMVDFLDHRTIGFRTPQYDVESTGQQIYQIGFESLQRVFSPEWINRLDEIVAFRPLSSDILRQVLDRMLLDGNDQYLRQGIHVDVSPDAKEYLLEKGFEPRFGARPLRQCLLKELDAPLADLVASGGIPKGSRVIVIATGRQSYGDTLEFYYESAPELLAKADALRAADAIAKADPDPSLPSVSLQTGGLTSIEHKHPLGIHHGPHILPRRKP